MHHWDAATVALLASIVGLLTLATLVGAVLAARAKTDDVRRTVDNLNSRTRAWWVMAAVFAAAMAAGPLGACVLFALVSFLAMREVVTLTPTRLGDHRTLFWAFFVIIPIQYWLICVERVGIFSIFVPVYCFLFIAIRSALHGDATRYLERTAKIQWAVFICVYCVSHAPALLTLRIPGYDGESWKLLVFLVVVVQLSDVLQYVWGKLLGRRKIAPNLSPNKTWEGFVGGVLTATAIGAAMTPITPFRVWQAALIALMSALLGFFAGLVMSAIKRDAGVKDYGHLIAGHGGMMDRIDSLTFAAPVFFHVVRFYFVPAT
jgi:phosphatidate cytidylyltransferase